MQFSNSDMTLHQQNDAAYKYFHGEGALVSQVEKFMGGAGNFGNLWSTESTDHGPLRVIPERLHRQHGKIYAAGKNIIGRNIEKAHMSKPARCSGRTIRNAAVATIREAKKMLSLVDEAVTASILAKVGGEIEYRSGKTEVDFVNFLLYRMYNWKLFNGASGEATSAAVADPAASDDNKEVADANETDDARVFADDAKSDADAVDGVVEGRDAPIDYLPVGFIYFMTRGPLADAKYRADFLSVDNFLQSRGPSRKDDRTEQGKKSKNERDYMLGEGKGGRGLALGANSQKDIVVIAQHQSKIANQAYDSEIVKADMQIKAKQEQVKTWMDMAKMCHEIGDKSTAASAMSSAKTLLAEITQLVDQMSKLKNASAPVSQEVEAYLEKGRVGMGLDGPAAKKQKADGEGGEGKETA